jgi:molybdopterin converting factor small subunit
MEGAIKVEFYGLLRRRVRKSVVEIDADDLTVLALLRRADDGARERFLDELLDPERALLAGTIVLVNGENIRLKQGLETRVRAGDTVALFSPAGGG